MKKCRVTTFIIILFFLLPGCGYHLASSVNPMLDNYTSIAIPYFKNKTFEAEAVTIFTHAFVDEFVESQRLKVETLDTADLVLYGTVKKLDEETVAYNSDDKALEYRVRVTLTLSLEEKATGRVLWKRKNLIHDEEYLTGDRVIVSETTKRKSLVLLAEDLAERAHDSILQGF